MTAVIVDKIRHLFPAIKSKAPRVALDGVSLSVEAGEFFCLLGPNGGGKTTLFRILSTLILPTEGSASIMGHDLVTEADAVRRTIGVVFQNPSLDKKLTLRENLIHHGHLYGLRGDSLDARIEENASLLGVQDRLEDRVESLSGGLQRRGEIAKALLPKPSVLLMDEPSTGLDPGARRALRDTIFNLKQQGVTVLLTTHLMEEADTCDRLAILHHGHLVAMGTPSELKHRIGGDVITIESDSPQKAADQIKNLFNTESHIMDGFVRLEKKNGHEFIPTLVTSLPGLITSLRIGKPTLEDVFAKETGQIFWSEDGRIEATHE